MGQGERKGGGKNPPFELNLGAAMVRDNIKRLSRRTWCTTKKPAALRDLLDIYAWFHNSELLTRRKRSRRPRVLRRIRCGQLGGGYRMVANYVALRAFLQAGGKP